MKSSKSASVGLLAALSLSKRPIPLLCAVLCASSLLVACGQKRPLRLPESTSKSAPASPERAASAADQP
ncbi:hypothetical protein ACG0Z6_01345 [Roseateles sp. BYS180W]|uniref:Lipoprotein n=1 Tax=Roseateles rivi TaxID=3299028 RepID=A0ABW7FRB9_9BURK